jgi:hypothetical protein
VKGHNGVSFSRSTLVVGSATSTRRGRRGAGTTSRRWQGFGIDLQADRERPGRRKLRADHFVQPQLGIGAKSVDAKSSYLGLATSHPVSSTLSRRRMRLTWRSGALSTKTRSRQESVGHREMPNVRMCASGHGDPPRLH